MKPHLPLIPFLFSLSVLTPQTAGATSTTQTENPNPTLRQAEFAVESFQLAQTPESNPYLLSGIAVVLVKVGQFDTPAESLSDRALEVARSIPEDDPKASLDNDPKASALSGIAVALAASGQLERALEVAGSIPSDDGKASALIDIADYLTENGNKEKATEIIEEAIALVEL